jgi:hypothetical protein
MEGFGRLVAGVQLEWLFSIAEKCLAEYFLVHCLISLLEVAGREVNVQPSVSAADDSVLRSPASARVGWRKLVGAFRSRAPYTDGIRKDRLSALLQILYLAVEVLLMALLSWHHPPRPNNRLKLFELW